MKLTQKGGKYLPTASVMKLMPAGTGSLNEVPTLERYLRTNGGNRELAIKQYSAAIRDVTRVFGRVHQTSATLEEHDLYMVWIAAWAQISGFGLWRVRGDRRVAVRKAVVRSRFVVQIANTFIWKRGIARIRDAPSEFGGGLNSGRAPEFNTF